jgi:hypothetical protein
MKKTYLFLFLFLFSLYVLSISSVETSEDNNEGFLRITVLENLIKHGHIWVAPKGKTGWGVPGPDGMLYNWHEFGQNFFVFPLYLLFRWSGYSFFTVNAAATALTALLIYKILLFQGYRERPSLAVSLLYGTATMAWYYASKTPHEGALGVFFIVGAFYFALRYMKGQAQRKYLLWCGLFVGLGFITRTDVILSAAPILIFIFLKEHGNRKDFSRALKPVLVFCLILLPFFAWAAFYNYLRFGSVLKTGQVEWSGGHLLSIGTIPFAFAGYLFSPGKSVFLFSPILLAAPWGLWRLYRSGDRNFFLFLVSFIGLYFVFYLNASGWPGDQCWGPRYLLPLIPFLMLPIVYLFESWGAVAKPKRVMLVVLICLSISVQVLSVSENEWLSNVPRFGFQLDNSSLPKRSIPGGDIGILKDYFIPGRSQLYSQLRFFSFTLRTMLEGRPPLGLWIKFVQTPPRTGSSDFYYVLATYTLPRFCNRFDFWWLQNKISNRTALLLVCLVALFSFSLYRLAEGWKGPGRLS